MGETTIRLTKMKLYHRYLDVTTCICATFCHSTSILWTQDTYLDSNSHRFASCSLIVVVHAGDLHAAALSAQVAGGQNYVESISISMSRCKNMHLCYFLSFQSMEAEHIFG